MTALLGLGGALVQVILCYRFGPTQAFHQALTVDPLALFFQCFAILLGILTVVSAGPSREIPNDKRPEFYALVVAFVFSICLLSAASNLILCFLVLQLMNLLGYFLSGFGKRSVLSSEAAIKYLVFGSVAAALFLYAAALLFLSAKSLNLYEIHRALVLTPLIPQAAWVIFLMFFLSLGAQIFAFPMHMIAPDVLEGSPTVSSALLSVGPRAAGLVLLIRIVFIVFWFVVGPIEDAVIIEQDAGNDLSFCGRKNFTQYRVLNFGCEPTASA
jgi:NADH:ubiquinone oxidoreductase subunit 2 (subunit N)